MAVTATIAIKLEAQTAELRKGFEQGKRQIQGLRESIDKGLGRGIVAFNQALQVTTRLAGEVRRLFASVNETVQRNAALGDFADRIGINVERLQELNLVTSQFGGNAQAMQLGMQRLTRRTALAAKTNNAFAKSMRAVGIDVEAISKLSPDEQFLRMSDAIAGLTNEGQQLQLIMEGMDTEAIALADTMRLGSEQIRELMAEMRELAVVSEDQVRVAQEAAAEWELWTRQMKAWKDAAVLEVLPVMRNMAKIFTPDLTGFGRAAFRGLFGENLADAISEYFRQIQITVGSAAERGDDRRRVGDAAAAVSNDLRETKWKSPGAVTSTSVAGFSAHQAWTREQERKRWEAGMIARLDKLIDTTKASKDKFTAVSIV